MSYFKELQEQRMNDYKVGQLSLELEHKLDPDVWYHNVEVAIGANRRSLFKERLARLDRKLAERRDAYDK